LRRTVRGGLSHVIERVRRRRPLWPTEGFVAEGQIRGQDFGFTDYLHQANIAEAANGDLLIACKGNRDVSTKGSDLSRNALTLWRSTDGGRTWGIVPTPFPATT